MSMSSLELRTKITSGARLELSLEQVTVPRPADDEIVVRIDAHRSIPRTSSRSLCCLTEFLRVMMPRRLSIRLPCSVWSRQCVAKATARWEALGSQGCELQLLRFADPQAGVHLWDAESGTTDP